MIEKFKKLSKRKKWVVGIIAFLLFPITIMLMAAELAINGFKEDKILKLILGIIILFIVAPMAGSDSSSVSKDLYDNQKVELEETISKLDKANDKLDKVNDELEKAKTELNDKDKIIEKAKIYLELNDDEKSKVSEFINEMKNPQDTTNKDKNDNTNKGNDSSSSNKSSSNVASKPSNNSGNTNNVASKPSNNSGNTNNVVSKPSNNSSVNLTSERIVYANGGTSTSNKYHSSPTAHNMEGAIKMTESQAKSKGYVACKRCY